MGRPVVAVHAVHFADFVLANIVGELRVAVDGNHSSGIGEADPGDVLTSFVRGNILDPVADRHVPVNAAHRTMARVAASDFQNQSY